MTNPHLDAASVTDLERIEEAISQASRQETMVRLTRFQTTPPNLVGTSCHVYFHSSGIRKQQPVEHR
jgi:hypothetical protein